MNILTPTPTPKPPESPIMPGSVKTSKKVMRWLKFGLAALVIIIVAGYGVLFLGVDAFGWSNARTATLTKYIPVTVGLIGWRPVSASSDIEQKLALQQYQVYAQKNAVSSSDLSDPSAAALTKVLKDDALQALLKQYNIKVSSADIEHAYQTQLTQSGSSTTIDQALKELYGWTPKEFKKYVVTQDVGRDKLMEKFSFDTTMSAPIKKQADTVRALISADGKNFADIAKKYSQDSYAANGGDTGLISKGQLTQELETPAFSLAVGAVSDVIHTKYGFHILQVVSRTGTGDTEQVDLRSIFLSAPSVDDAINKFLTDHHVLLLVHGFSWDKATFSAIAKTTGKAKTTNTNTSTTNVNAATNQNVPMNTNGS